MKGARPHFQVVGLMNDATLISPVSMQCENEVLEGHEQSSRGYGGLNSRANAVKRTEKLTGIRGACQGATPLGSRSCSMLFP
jgi:hypothetical protein